MRKLFIPLGILLAFGMYSCQESSINEDAEDILEFFQGHVVTYSDLRFDPVEVGYLDPSARILEENTPKLKLVSASYYTDPESGEFGRTIFFEDRGNKQLDFDWSPFAKLNGVSDISYYLDITRPSSSLPLGRTDAAIERAVSTWENVSCSNTGLYKEPSIPFPIGIAANILGFPSIPGYIADVNHSGWMPGLFFERLVAGGSQFILGVTFTFLLVDENNNFIDTNNDGKFDVGVREIYYNDNFTWSDSGAGFDVETIALHEMGHGLSQEHFGGAFRRRSGGIQFTPRAVMNATYSGIQRELSGTDNGGHCSIWGNWPNK